MVKLKYLLTAVKIKCGQCAGGKMGGFFMSSHCSVLKYLFLSNVLLIQEWNLKAPQPFFLPHLSTFIAIRNTNIKTSSHEHATFPYEILFVFSF